MYIFFLVDLSYLWMKLQSFELHYYFRNWNLLCLWMCQKNFWSCCQHSLVPATPPTQCAPPAHPVGCQGSCFDQIALWALGTAGWSGNYSLFSQEGLKGLEIWNAWLIITSTWMCLRNRRLSWVLKLTLPYFQICKF